MTSIESDNHPPWLEAERLTARARAYRTLRKALWSLGKGIALVTLLGVGLDVATMWVPQGQAPQPFPRSAPDAWSVIRRPLPLFGLTGTDFAKLPLDYQAVRNAGGGGRRDLLTFGDLQGDKGWLRLSLYRIGTEAAAIRPASHDLAALARDVAEISDMSAPTPLVTRFGDFEALDLRLVTRTGGSTPCLGFRSQADETAPLRVAGLACGSVDHPVGRDLLGCIVERLDLLSAGDDQVLRDVFVAAERRRGSSCLPSPLRQAGSRTTWLDANAAAPVLKR